MLFYLPQARIAAYGVDYPRPLSRCQFFRSFHTSRSVRYFTPNSLRRFCFS